MKPKNHTKLLQRLYEEYQAKSPQSAALHQQASKYMIDGGSHTLRLTEPFPPKIVQAQGAWLKDADGHRILDFWQGHYTNLLGHNPEVVTQKLAEVFSQRWGLQSGFTDEYQIAASEIICRQTGSERIRFTTSGGNATTAAINMAKAYTGRPYVMKVAGGWHGANPMAMKAVALEKGFQELESLKPPTDNTIITGFNNSELMEAQFERYGEQIACFILEPVIGAGGMMPSRKDFLQKARQLTEKFGSVLIFDEVISCFRFRAGDVGALYNIKPDLITLGKVIGGGMPVAAVAGKEKIMRLCGKNGPVKFSGGTYAAHPASMVASCTFLNHLVEHQDQLYPRLEEGSRTLRKLVKKTFQHVGIDVRFAGDQREELPGNSLHMLLFPYQKELPLDTPEEVLNPEVCDIVLSEQVFHLAMLLENVKTVHGLGATVLAHGENELLFLESACQKVAERFKKEL
ncbi:aminotransferase class III-fold pyridoxal phosphate-dependent enzyme [Rapidithrix thailandica]|uniref:Aminotransferase class III-fold pyridoxal phosphate-dependent enzyme n=1 Tax=Rapidithrix thailandica TaxID=413964 RepID=A0AAW9S7P3_9BACT